MGSFLALADVSTNPWEPWAYWRTVTIVLAASWFLSGVVRLVTFHRRWERRLAEFGASRRWLRLQLGKLVLRVVVLDPVNLALLLLIGTIWSVPLWLPTA